MLRSRVCCIQFVFVFVFVCLLTVLQEVPNHVKHDIPSEVFSVSSFFNPCINAPGDLMKSIVIFKNKAKDNKIIERKTEINTSKGSQKSLVLSGINFSGFEKEYSNTLIM